MPKARPIQGSVTQDIEDRFWEKTERRDDCLVWIAASRESGTNAYGVFRFSPPDAPARNVGAHRFSLYMELGRDPGETVHHTCYNTLCVDPGHLQPDLTRAENNRLQKKNLSAFCKRGHPRNEKNTYINPGTGARQCRACLQDREDRRYEEKYAKDKEKWTHSSEPVAGKFSFEEAEKVRELYAQGGESYRSLGRKFKVSPSLIGQIIRNEVWKAPKGVVDG